MKFSGVFVIMHFSTLLLCNIMAAQSLDKKEPGCLSIQTQILDCSHRPATQQRECDALGPILDVMVESQRSGSSCELDGNYHIKGSSLWVDTGCSATFRVRYVTKNCAEQIECDSWGFGYGTCSAGGLIQQAKVHKLYSSVECEMSKTFGFKGSQIWVAKGCRAKFEVSIVKECLSIYTQELQCSSWLFLRRTCRAAGHVIDVTVTEAQTGSYCKLNETYGYQDDSVWVSRGCRAKFNIRYVTNDCDQNVKCESWGYGRKTCNTGGIIMDARVTIQYSTVDCILNKSYGFEGFSLWVDQGCRALFRVFIMKQCLHVNTEHRQCVSASGRVECPVAWPIVDAQIQHRQSASPCVLGTSYGFENTSLWVDKGCGADFKVIFVKAECKHTVRCNSFESERSICYANGHVLNAKVAEDTATSSCVVNQTFGFQNSYVWVDRGCSASFEVDIVKKCLSVKTQNLSCSSWLYGSRVCAAQGPIVEARVLRQVSAEPCLLNANYASDGSALWVARGCRADFLVRYLRTDCTEKVECRSVNSTRTTCNTNGLVLDAAVDKEHSTAPCIRNESFGFESSHIWADKGCWATFIVKTD